MSRIVYILLILVLLISCSNKEELARLEKIKQDSINSVIENAKKEAANSERSRIENEMKELERSKLELENKRYSIDEVIGNWEVFMDCVNSNCSGASKGDKKTETWYINFENQKINVKVIGNTNTNTSYTGTFNGKNLILKAQIQESGFLSDRTVAVIEVNLEMKSDNSLIGDRTLVKEGPCKIEYQIRALKK